MSSLRSLFSQTVIYGSSTMVVRFLSYLLVPFYTYVLKDPANYGLLSELYSYTALLNILYLCGMETTYFRYAGRGYWTKYSLFGQLLGLILISSTCFSVILYVTAAPLAQVLGYIEGADLLKTLALLLFLDAVVALPFARLRLERRAGYFALLRLLSVVANLVLNGFFLWFCPRAALGAWGTEWQSLTTSFYVPNQHLYYILVSNLLSNLLWIPLFYKHWRALRFDFRRIKTLLCYGVPIMGMGLAGMGIEMLPRLLFRHFFEAEASTEAFRALGTYAACAKLAVVMLLGIQAYRYAADPFMLSQLDRADRKQLATAVRYFVFIGSWLMVGTALYADDLAMMFLRGEAYRAALPVLPMLLFAHLCMGLYYNLGIWCKRSGKTHYIFYISLGGLILSLCILTFTVSSWGYFSMAASLLISYLCMAIVCYFWGQKRYPIPYKWGRVGLYLGVGWAMMLVASPAFSWNISDVVGLPSVFFVVYTFIFWIMNRKLWHHLIRPA